MTGINRKSSNLLPAFFRTERNEKFLSSTLDQLVATPQLERIDAYIGSKDTLNYKDTDQYISETNPLRSQYQLEPALIVKTLTQEIKKAFALDDLLNQITSHGGDSSNLDRIFTPRFYSYDPKIDWDKFINFREYFWLPTGPAAVTVVGDKKAVLTEISIRDAEDNIQFFFDDKTSTPQLTLYRGSTYVFNVDSIHNFYIKNTNSVGPNDQYTVGITGNGTKKGQIIFSVGYETPSRLFYVSNDNQLSTGVILIKDPLENSIIDVDNDIVGKLRYTSANDIELINGLKIKFNGVVFPEKYRDVEFIVDGVGSSIKLIPFSDLDTPDMVSDFVNIKFDGSNFDQFPFDSIKNLPLVPEYITISKASSDLNPWTRYNRWFHSDVIRAVARYQNNATPEYPANYRAARPIIEFTPDLHLYNFGSVAVPNIDLIDNATGNVFYEIENQSGFFVDGVLLEEGLRVIFNADTDPLVNGKVFRVQFLTIAGKTKIDLVPEDAVNAGSVTLVRQGVVNGGTSWYYNGTSWIKGQQRISRNQAPLFDLFDNNGISYSDKTYNSNFTGNKIFGYGVGSGVTDPVLGFPLLYRNIGVEGTYLFKNYFSSGEFLIVNNDKTEIISTSQTYFKNKNLFLNVWSDVEKYHILENAGGYEVPLNLTNNPLNGPISEFTLTELSNHISSMINRSPDFIGQFPGVSNLRDLSTISRYGTKLISNLNSLGFAHHFVTDKENNVVDAVRLVGEHYYQFRFNLIKSLSLVSQSDTPADSLDNILLILNQNKTTTFPYYHSDMIPHGTGSIVKNYKVGDSKNNRYGLPAAFDIKKLGTTGILIYLNNIQLAYGIDYDFEEYEDSIKINSNLARNDIITIKYFNNTLGNFIPPTPTKLGLYPKYEPKIYIDDTYAVSPTRVIQGHDGSITVAFNDYRDNILLEYEKRVFNNLKITYNPELLDINSLLPGAYRQNSFSSRKIWNPILVDFLKWKSTYGVEIEKNLTFDINNHRTYNYGSVTGPAGDSLPGNWRGIYKTYFDTDRPHTSPWEILGFPIKPKWWEEVYGPAPYTSGHSILWKDLEDGRIREPNDIRINPIYSRPGLSSIIPVDEYGNLVDVRFWGILGEKGSLEEVDANWKFGDNGPAESAWRRSAYWPFAVQIVLALSNPATYSALLYDTSRVVKNKVGQFVYSNDNLFLSHSRVLVPYEKNNNEIIFTSGYSVFVVEAGLIKNSNYVDQLSAELSNSTFNLMNKIGGFVSKDKLEIVIDSVNPNSINPGILLPMEDFSIQFNVSSPVKVVNISGLIIQKSKGGYIIRGYDQSSPFFNKLPPNRQNSDPYITVGGKSESFLPWSKNMFYSLGQVVSYDNAYYRANNNHNSGLIFSSSNYIRLKSLPLVNGITAQYSTAYDVLPVQIPYGEFYSSIQEVVDFISGYGKWLESQGFMFDGYDKDLGEVLDWKLSIKEFLFWSAQNWTENSIIAVSPFATSIKFKFQDSVVDDIFNSFYNYTLLQANGNAFPQNAVSISRADGTCTISSKNGGAGIFFASLRLVQKEHALIFNNLTRFNDVIYDIETGYRQRRIRLIGFRTSNWNGDYFSPGFIYDSAKIQIWKSYEDYLAGDVVEYAGNYYSLDRSLSGTEKFDFTKWNKLSSKPTAQLIPNFDYKISQFEDFYSLDIDNFDLSQQQLAQHLTGYSSRVYLNNIFFNPIAQYKFYQGFIREKGTKNALEKLARASVHNLQGKIDFNEEWAFRVGAFGAYSSLQEIEFALEETKFVDNSQLITFTNEPPVISYDPTTYITPSNLLIKPVDYDPDNTFPLKNDPFNLEPFALPVAGYVLLDDVDYAVKTKQDLLTFIPGKTVQAGDTFWIGFDNGGDWGVYRYARMPVAVVATFDTGIIAGKSIGFETTTYHGLKVGDVVAVTRFSDSLNGIYIVTEIPLLNRFVVNSSEYAGATTNDYGVLFKFFKSRFEKFDDLANTDFLADIKPGRKIWVDSNVDGQWEVYAKIDNYSPALLPNRIIVDDSYYGDKIVSKEESDTVIISASRMLDDNGTGRVFVYTNNNGVITNNFNYGVNSLINQYYSNTGGNTPAKFGKGLDFDGVDGVIAAGAPFASNVKANGSGYINSINAGSGNVNEGLVILSTISVSGSAESRHVMLASPDINNNSEFGTSVFIGSTSTRKILLVGAPGYYSSSGAVYSYDVAYYKSFDGSTVEVNATSTTQIKITAPYGVVVGPATPYPSRFGEKIAGDKTGTKIAVTAPMYNNGSGAVYIFTDLSSTSTYSLIQTLVWNDTELGGNISSDGKFGWDVSMDDSGNWLFVSAYNAYDKVLQRGKVVVYGWDTDSFVFSQIIHNPTTTTGLKFGQSVETDASGNIVTITAQGPNYFTGVTFDTGITTFDSNATGYGTLVDTSGSAYVYNRYDKKFIFATELINSSVQPGSIYGYATSVNRDAIYVGAPLYVSTGTTNSGMVHIWNAIDPGANSWALVRQQEALVDTDRIKQIKTINVFHNSVEDYLDVFDPLKGKIPQVADREIRYKTLFDPAVYNTGTEISIVIDTSTAWGADHVGELWWDLSSIKYVWYEQGNVEHRKNIWGSTFPGCTVDIYEWVQAPYTPSSWVTDADTPAGLTAGVSGQPKYSTNTAYSYESKYNISTDINTSVYYYWVKNTVILPNRQGRRISAYEVASLIEDPTLHDVKFIKPLSKNSLVATNIKVNLINDQISLNIHLDEIQNNNNKHTEWLLLEEGSARSVPNTLLEKKFLDSLLGRDSLGNPVPDSLLSDREKYGIGVRPRQSMFKDRFSALRNSIEYINTIFEENLITDFYNLETLSSKEDTPKDASREYDIIVEDLAARDLIYTRTFLQASLTCEIVDGKISEVRIVNAGAGYGKLIPVEYDTSANPILWKGPIVEIYNDENDGSIETLIDSAGTIVQTVILNRGGNYINPPELYVRPYTALILVDEESKGRWAKYSFTNTLWIKVKTQSYNTTLYWDNIDWLAKDFNQYQRISGIVNYTYQVGEIELQPGDYIKVNNNGAGRYIILRKTLLAVNGTFDANFDIMFSEKGTIKISDSIWKYTESRLGWDQVSPYDNTFFDQTPDIELEKIFLALKHDIFIGNLKVYWNKLFFAGVKYALTEQKFLDWAFKTSFISVHNNAGDLTQRPVYKFQDTTWYESYLKEIKPYHTQIRNYELTYNLIDPSNTFTTDFDLPVVYNKDLDQYIPLTGDSTLAQTTYPYKGWYDNRTLFVDSISVDDPGSGYIDIPLVHIIPAPGENITRPAVAEAILSGGKIDRFEIIDPGKGYLQNPSIVIAGGGVTETGSVAKASAILANKKVRVNQISLKFDRISKSKQIGTKNATDTFTASGVQTDFTLTWPAAPDKDTVFIKINGIIAAASTYYIEDFFVKVAGYKKRYSKIVLDSPPNKDSIILITYSKSLSIYSAYDRISDYFNVVPTNSPGANPEENYAQLMAGMEYPGTELKTLDLYENYAWDIDKFNSVGWDKLAFQTTDLDVAIAGGTLTTSTGGVFATASGISPTDIILDGDAFISPTRSYAPEELVPGEMSENISINVFTRNTAGSPTIYTQFIRASASTDSTTQLTIVPPSVGSISVRYNRVLMKYYNGEIRTIINPDSGFAETSRLVLPGEYTVDFSTRTIFVAGMPDDGMIAIVYMDVGGTGFISFDHAVVEGTTEGAVIGNCLYQTVNSVYVTVNGQRVLPPDSYTGQDIFYIMSERIPGSDSRVKVTVYGLGTDGDQTISAAFFTERFKAFSEIYEQYYENLNAGDRLLKLQNPPGKLGPSSANSIVEVSGRRIIPPDTTYYEITDTNQNTFVISNKLSTFPHDSFDKTTLEIYKNGKIIPAAGYYLDDYNNQIILPAGTFQLGDVLAITTLVDYDYIIRGDTIEITERIPLSFPNYVRILTFATQDASLIRTEVFKSNSARLYKLSRSVINDNFVWLSVGGNTLASGADFEVLDDCVTIQIDMNIPYVVDEEVIITTFSEKIASRTTGYKILRDTVGRTHYKRLSKAGTTYLLQPLQLTDTEIVVENGAVLPEADIKMNVPGIIFIAGERIEYFTKNDNVLTGITRATFGTGAKDYYGIGTWVQDQSIYQTIPYADNVRTQIINTSSSVISISTTTFSLTGLVDLSNQLEIYYGSKLLEKPADRLFQDATINYDPVNMIAIQPDFIITGTVVLSVIYAATLTLSFTPDKDIPISIAQRTSTSWYNFVGISLLDITTPQALFINAVDAIIPDDLYHGGDQSLTLNDGTVLTLDDGTVIKGY